MFTFGMLTYNMLVYIIVGVFTVLQATSLVGEWVYNKQKACNECASAPTLTSNDYAFVSHARHKRGKAWTKVSEMGDVLLRIDKREAEKSMDNASEREPMATRYTEQQGEKLHEGIAQSIWNRPPPEA